EVVLCDRYYDSTTAYQGYGRGLDLKLVQAVINFAVGETRPHLTLLMQAPPEVSAARLASRQSTLPFVRDRIEEADRDFFERVTKGYEALAKADPQRIKVIDAARAVEAVSAAIWKQLEPWLAATAD
ncbi:MAG: tmk, partial [Pedosphaera sp.]|nr:tmk [Pedosphaera sp.]